MASSKKDIMIPMHEGVGAIPTVVLNKLLLPVKISTGFLSFSPAVIVASSFPKMTTSDCHSLIFLYLQHRHVAQLVERFNDACIMVVMRTAKFFKARRICRWFKSNRAESIMAYSSVRQSIWLLTKMSLVQIQLRQLQSQKFFKKQKRVSKRGSLSAKVRMGFVYVYGESQGQTVERMVCGDDEKNRDERAMDSVQPHGILLSDFAEFQREI